MNIKHKIIICFAFFSCLSINSQEIYTRREVDSMLSLAYQNIVVDSMTQALELLNKTLRISKELNYKNQEATTYNHFSGLYVRIEPEMETSVNYLKKSLPIYKELNLNNRVITTYTNMTYMYKALNRQKEFDSIARIADDLIKKSNSYLAFYLAESMVFNAFENTKDYEAIDSITYSSLNALKKFKFKTKEEKKHKERILKLRQSYLKIYRGIALIELNKNIEEANKLFDEVLSLNKNDVALNSSRHQKKLLNIFIYKQKYYSNHNKNKDSLLKYYAKTDSLRAHILEDQEVLNLKNYKYATLNIAQKEKMKTLEFIQEKNSNLRRLSNLTIGLVLVALVISTFFVVYYKKANKRIIKTLNDKKEIELKLNNIQKAIASDLHDNFGNRISGILSSSEIVKELINQKQTTTAQFLKYLSNLNQGVGNLLYDLKDLIWSYEVNNDSIIKLSYRMNQYIEEFSISYDIKIKHETSIYNGDTILPHLWNRQILLTFKEAINNAYKHAQADTIVTSLSLNESNILEVLIRDNGVGFKQGNVKMSGISNMKKRAESIGCKLNIRAVAGQGTEIVLVGKIIPN